MHPLAGKPAPRSILVNVPRLITAYFVNHPDLSKPEQQVAFETSGHRGGLKVITEHGWFAARPSGTEDVYKVYGESFKGAEHVADIMKEAQQILDNAFRQAGV